MLVHKDLNAVYFFYAAERLAGDKFIASKSNHQINHIGFGDCQNFALISPIHSFSKHTPEPSKNKKTLALMTTKFQRATLIKRI